MTKQSAGLLVFRRAGAEIEFLLVHPGGPFWAKKDDGAWFIPKGEIEAGEEPFATALREFREELGVDPPAANPIELGTVKNKSGKLIYAWAIEGEVELGALHSNTFELEWPPKSGKLRQFPEVDRAEYFAAKRAPQKMHPAELPLAERLLQKLGEAAGPPSG